MLLSTLLKRPASAKESIDFGGNWYSSPVTFSGGFASKTSSGEIVSTGTAMTVPAFFACIRAISEDLSKLPLGVFRRLERGRESVYDHPAAKSMRKPNTMTTSFAMRETWIQHALALGNGYIEVTRDGQGNPINGYLLDPATVKPLVKNDRISYVVTVPETQQSFTLPSEDVLHLHGIGYDSVFGYQLPSIFREIIGAALAARKFGAAYWGNGAHLGGVLEHPGALGEEALKHLREQFQARHGGAENTGKWFIAEEGMKLNQFDTNPGEAQLVETYQFNVEDIARIFRMPLHKIGHLLRATFSNIEHQALEYVGDTIMPWAVRIEQELDRKLFRDDEDDLYFRHNMNALMRPDAAARSDYYIKMMQLGMTQNQILELEDMNPIGPEGDIPYVMMNIRPATQDAREASIEKPATVSQGAGDGSTTNTPNKGGRPRNEVATEYSETFEAMLEPLARKECNATSKASRKFDARNDFVSNVQRFHVEHRAQMIASLAPALGSLVAIIGGDRKDPQVGITASNICDQHCVDSIKDLIDVDHPYGVEALMEHWVLGRVKTDAGRLTRAALAIVEG